MQVRSRGGATSVVTCVLATFTAMLAPGVAHAADSTPPTTPDNLRIDVSFTHATVSWGSSTDHAGWVIYTVDFSTHGDSNRYASTETTKTFGPGLSGDLLPGATYTATVVAQDAAGNVSAPAVRTVTIPQDVEQPSAPSNLRFEGPAGSVSSTVAWDAAADNQDDILYTLYKEDPEHGGEDGLYPLFHTEQTRVSVFDLNSAFMVFPGDTLTLRVVATDVGRNDSQASAPLTHKFVF